MACRKVVLQYDRKQKLFIKVDKIRYSYSKYKQTELAARKLAYILLQPKVKSRFI